MAVYLAGPSALAARSAIKQLSWEIACHGIATLHSWTGWSVESHPHEEFNWLHCCAEIDQANAVVVCAMAPELPLRGALFEAGYAIAKGKPVFIYNVTGYDVGTWKHHSLCYEFQDFLPMVTLLRGK